MEKTLSRIQQFMQMEASAGLVLMGVAVLAMLFANTGLAELYTSVLDTNIRVGIGTFEISKPALLWINDGLMAIFFFLIGLEIKREVLLGELSSFDKAILPIMAAIGGMAVPGLVYVMINLGTPENLNGWAIPAATDIAFALGVLALLGSRAPVALKVFLLAVAIIDDLGAIIIIALFYTSELSTNALTFSMLGFAGAVVLNRMGIQRIAPYIIIGVIMWVFVLKSGVHATLAGVLIALTIPLKEKNGEKALLYKVEHALHPWVAYMILPIFAFANAGVSLSGLSVSDLTQPLTLGIAAGLFLGKQMGVVALTFIGVKSGIAKLPDGINWFHLYGVACLTGIGFTMSLFVGSLAFGADETMNAVRLGVIFGSVLSGLLGFAVLRSMKATPATD
ncbi:Na+/H+ antiporter NhaA [Cognatishimia activa]|uniref:Na(+)/H(+) antiporter NhaA n=1 Tax=Cognatishimia activa TaxID=1715691 RepID=A0A0P1IWE7_9RHOB|nr:Na+/H+ antiporter NhaA [Cognatishimia activa]CUI62551.1 Sodium/proton antiporter NhaA [Cognatishimia activa]CUK26334.1 Sodium/proton antiporter NhaA [Cognatishimia activa]